MGHYIKWGFRKNLKVELAWLNFDPTRHDLTAELGFLDWDY
jgi:hypothetical protein